MGLIHFVIVVSVVKTVAVMQFSKKKGLSGQQKIYNFVVSLMNVSESLVFPNYW